MGSFMNQANALLRKNLTFQKRNLKTNLCLVAFPILICVLLAGLQSALDKASKKANADLDCTNQEFFTDPPVCPIRSPPKWPALLHLPFNEDRAVKTRFTPFADLPDDSCRKNGSCPVTILLTGGNQSLGQSMAGNLYPSLISFNISGNSSSDILEALSNVVLGSPKFLVTSNLLESTQNWSIIQPKCPPTFGFSVAFNVLNHIMEKDITCVEGLHLWRNNSSVVNDELFKGHSQGNPESRTNEILAAYDFLNSNDQKFNVNIWYNLIYRGSKYLLHVPRLVNMVSNSYLQFVRGAGFKILIDFVMEMPKPAVTREDIELTTYLGPIFFTWVILQLFPVVLKSLVYEKQQNLRIMMKMHGLGDGPYWIISYAYFFFISSAYMLCFMLFGSLIGLKLFRLNDYTIQFVFYFIYVNLQIAFAFLVATIFSNVKTASVIAQIFVLASGLFGQFLFRSFIEDESAPRVLIIVLEIFPAFSLYRGLYEFVQFSSGTFQGMQWKDLNYNAVGMRNVMFIMLIEWVIVLFFGYYLDQVVTVGSGVRRHPLFFLQNLRKKPSSSLRMPSLQREARVVIQMERPDVFQEMEKVEQLLLEPNASHAVICNHIKKVYPGMDGNPDKVAVRGLSPALPRGECFGMLGPNGAGKTSFISMMIGRTNPSSGTAFVQGLDIRTDMDKIYTSMGVCPQHDLLWETLTGREHLHFYGRLKNLEGSALTRAVDESLKSVNLFHGGVGDKQAGKYSGGMKRKLSVAISLIGDPKVVYMDEPSTGLDPASRKYLWNVVKRSKKDRSIILTTHSMEEAEVLCDRLGIFVDGSLQCIGNPKELKGRYGGSYVFTMTTSSSHEEDVENLAYRLCPDAKKIYHISRTQKFELPKEGVRIVDVFRAVQNAKRNFAVQAWGLADTTLEDVFVKVAAGAQAFNVLS